MQSQLEQKTQAYWHLSQVWEGRSKDVITTEDAIATTNKLQNCLNPERPLARRISQIGHAIVHGGANHEVHDSNVEYMNHGQL